MLYINVKAGKQETSVCSGAEIKAGADIHIK